MSSLKKFIYNGEVTDYQCETGRSDYFEIIIVANHEKYDELEELKKEIEKTKHILFRVYSTKSYLYLLDEEDDDKIWDLANRIYEEIHLSWYDVVSVVQSEPYPKVGETYLYIDLEPNHKLSRKLRTTYDEKINKDKDKDKE